MRSTRFYPWLSGLLLLASLCGNAGAATPAEDAALLLPDGPEARVLVLGELHGTHEAPALAGAVVEQRLDTGLPVTLALEIHAAEQPRLDAFLASEGDPAARGALLSGAFWKTPNERSDGRRSMAMLSLIERMRERREEGDDVRVLAFDAGKAGGGANERNRRMAEVLRDAINDAPERAFVVLIGNYHARRAAPTLIGGLMPGESAPVPTMAHLADLPMFRVNVSASVGGFWACGSERCGPQSLRARDGDIADESDASASVAPAQFVATPHDAPGWDAQLVLPRFSVAEPVVTVPPTE
jgi:hypothetical protein